MIGLPEWGTVVQFVVYGLMAFLGILFSVFLLAFYAQRGAPAHGSEVYDWRRTDHLVAADQTESDIGAVADGGGQPEGVGEFNE